MKQFDTVPTSPKSASPMNPAPPLPPGERAALLDRIVADAPDTERIRVFAYGSLLWKPEFEPERAQPCTLTGYRRAFNFWSVVSRGSPERPGLGLGLARGGSCDGVAYELRPETRDRDLQAIWEREMYVGIYEARWVTVETGMGTWPAIAFVTDATHSHYAAEMSPDRTAEIIAGAAGENGPCRDYLASTVGALAAHGIRDTALSELLALVDGLRRNDSV